MPQATIAVDISKSVFQVAISKRPGRIAEEHRLSRAKFLGFLARLQPAKVVLEACGSAHHWGRQLQSFGHEVVLLPPRQVAAYRLGNKTDRADARALLEAFRNQVISPIPLKSIDQQTLTSLHRLRSQWVAERTARLNGIRGILREFGIFLPQGAHHVVRQVRHLLDQDDSPIPPALRSSLREACLEVRQLEDRAAATEKQLRKLIKQLPVAQRLLSIPGIGPLTATALVGFVGDVRRFPTARHFASFLGLTPRESSSGSIRRLGGLTKRGDTYLRMLLVHGARSVLYSAKRKPPLDRLRCWALHVERARGHNKAVCALGNKLARIVWSVWHRDVPYKAPIA